METGHILWIAHGKRKQVVYDFIEHVGLEWMSHVETVACDMNSDFDEAFLEKCPHIQPVFEHFHIAKNFNDKVVSAIHRDEQKRLAEEGAALLKKTRYILTWKRQALQQKDEDAQNGKVILRESALFNIEAYIDKYCHEARYNELMSQSKLFFICDLIEERMALAYSRKSNKEIAIDIIYRR